jgi:hypothetical protein
VGLVRVRPAEEDLLGPQGRGRPWFPSSRGLFPLLRAPATLDQMKIARSPELGRSPFWERSSRALPDPELLPRRVRRVGPRIPGCQIAPVASAESRRGLLARSRPQASQSRGRLAATLPARSLPPGCRRSSHPSRRGCLLCDALEFRPCFSKRTFR